MPSVEQHSVAYGPSRRQRWRKGEACTPDRLREMRRRGAVVQGTCLHCTQTSPESGIRGGALRVGRGAPSSPSYLRAFATSGLCM
eukprot:9469937-Pyramimonas_sp.AAC.4